MKAPIYCLLIRQVVIPNTYIHNIRVHTYLDVLIVSIHIPVNLEFIYTLFQCPLTMKGKDIDKYISNESLCTYRHGRTHTVLKSLSYKSILWFHCRMQLQILFVCLIRQLKK